MGESFKIRSCLFAWVASARVASLVKSRSFRSAILSSLIFNDFGILKLTGTNSSFGVFCSSLPAILRSLYYIILWGNIIPTWQIPAFFSFSFLAVNIGSIFQILQIAPEFSKIPADLSVDQISGFVQDLHNEAKRCFRNKAKIVHSDHHGLDADFMLLKDAYEACKLVGLEYREPGNYVGIVFGTRDLEVVDGRSCWAWVKNARGWRIGYTRHPGWGHDTRSSTDVSHRPPSFT